MSVKNGRKTRHIAFEIVKAKCMACGLHFMLCSDDRGRHNRHSLHCPECGQYGGGFLVWREEHPGFIFQVVPGSTPSSA
jgi:hypothetical protein